MGEQSDDRVILNDLAFCLRVTCYLDGESSAEELRSLDAELQADASKRDAFVRLCLVRAALIRQGTATRAEEPTPDPLGPLDDAVILPALRESDVQDDLPPSGLGAALTPARGLPVSGLGTLGRRLVYGAGLAAMLALGFGFHWAVRQGRQAGLAVHTFGPPAVRRPSPSQASHPSPTPPARPPAPAVVTATAGVVVDGPDLVAPQTALVAGRSVRLARGVAELTFADGAIVLVRAPADVQVVGADGLVVNSGAIYAHVSPAAHGFRVTAPGLDVVDRGTNFGVRTGTQGAATEVHVFEGRVDATGIDSRGRPTAGPVKVTTGNAVSHAAGAAGGTPVPVPFAPVGFDRTMAEVRLTVATHGTGAGLGGGAADPNWKIVSMPGLAAGQSRPALVLTNPRPDYAGVGPDACWVAPTARLLNASPGKYVYRTTLDLTGYNAGSASVKAVMTADDGILDVRVNGTSIALPPATVNQATWRSVAQTALVGAPWRAGPNQLDVVVYNGTTGTRLNPTGLLFGWTVTAAPLVRR